MQVTGRATWIVIGCAAAMLSACTSSAGDQALNLGTTSAPSTTVAIATTIPPTTTPMIDPPTTSPTTVAETTTTVAETTTTEAVPASTAPPSKEDEVRAAFTSSIEASLQCSYEPASCNFDAIAIPGSPVDEQRHVVVRDRLKFNLRAVPGQGDVNVRIDSVGFEGESAFVSICSFDTIVIYDIVDPSNPDDDIIYDDDQVSSKVRWELRKHAGKWLLYEGHRTDLLQGGDLCGF